MKVLLLGWLAMLATACGGSKCGPPSATVTNVVDGDTIDLDTGVRIRLLLVDTPEITKGKNECYAQEAAAFTGNLVAGQRVQLTYDEASCLDRYGRTLAYVKAGTVELNTALIVGGFACYDYIAPGGSARSEEFSIDEAEAKTNRIGMWGVCTSIPCSK